MSLFTGDITAAQKYVQTDIAQESTVIQTAITSFDAMIRSILNDYTIELKFVHK